MSKHILVFLFLLSATKQAFTQNKFVRELVEIKLPKDAKAVTQLPVYTSKDKTIGSFIGKGYIDNTFQVDSIYIEMDADVLPDTLYGKMAIYNRKFDLEDYKDISSLYKLTMQNVNGIHSVYAQHEFRNVIGRFKFYGVNASKSKIFTFTVEYDPKDRDRATKIFEQIKDSLKFK